MKYFIALSFLLVTKLSLSQNTFPASGSVGIGTTSPQEILQTSGGNLGILNSGTYLDPWGKWMRLGASYSASYPLYLGANKNGISAVWDSDGAFFGLSDEGSNRKDAIIAWGDDVDDNLRFLFNNGELARFTSSGNVGIGTTSPLAKLHVFSQGSGTAGLLVQGQNGDNWFPYTDGKNYLRGTTVLADVGGNVGIGTSSPNQKLEVVGNIKFNDKLYFGNWILGATGQWPSNPGLALNGGDETFGLSSNYGQISLQIDGAFRQQEAGKVNYFMDKVGIGNTNPDAMLTVSGLVHAQEVSTTAGVFNSDNTDLTLKTTGSNRLSISNATGNVGIGTINAPEKLTVTGNIQVPLSNAMGYLVSTDKLAHNGNSVGNYSLGWFWDSWQTGAPTGYLSSAGGLKFFTGSNLRMAIDAFGNVGIGTGSANLDAKLDVKGQVHAQEVKVDLSVPGPDYVFEKEYQLTSLEEIKNYIDQNKHLPEVPSAKEMEKNGVLLGEMNMLLLKKIEELTLHMIELKKENNSAQAQMKIMQLEINQLKK